MRVEEFARHDSVGPRPMSLTLRSRAEVNATVRVFAAQATLTLDGLLNRNATRKEI